MGSKNVRGWVWGGALILGITSASSDAALRKNQFSTFTAGGLKAQVQSLEVSNQIRKPSDVSIEFFQKDLNGDDDDDDQKPEYLPFVWTLGATYGRSVSPSVLDEVIGGRAGFEGEISGTGGLLGGVMFGLDSIPPENYRHGSIYLNFEYTFRLQPRSARQKRMDDDEEQYDRNDAWTYYKHQRRKIEHRRVQKGYSRFDDDDEEEEREVKRLYPYLRLVYHLGFNNHSIFPKVFRNFLLPALTQQLDLVQFHNRLDAYYAPDEREVFQVGLSYYGYSVPVEGFIAGLESDVESRMPAVFGLYPSSVTNQLLSFPWLSFDQSFEYSISEKDSLIVHFNETFYQAERQPNTYSFSPIYFVDLSKKWMMGLTGVLTLGNPNLGITGMVELHYRWK